MTAGKTCVLEMESNAFDTFLKLEDVQGKLLAENDDISKDNLNWVQQLRLQGVLQRNS